MNNRTGSRILCAVLASVTAVLLSCPAGPAAEARPVTKPEMEAELLSAMAALKGHIQGEAGLDAKQIEAHKLTIDKHRELLGRNRAIIKACFDLVATYDEAKGPLWVAHGGFNRRAKPPANDLHWTIYNVMQNIIDRVYTAQNIARYGDILNGFKFGSSAHFPGPVGPPADPTAPYSVKIDGSYLKQFKHALMHEERPARRPTGAYLAPGTIATVKAPPSIVGTGYQVRVDAHSWDNSRKPRVLRLDRSSLTYGIDSAEPGFPGLNGPKGNYNEKLSSDGKVFWDGDHWVTFFFGVGRGGAHVMTAFSRNLHHWTVDPDPIYKAGRNPSGLDKKYAHKISLIWNPANETYYMFYCAVGNKGRGIGLITSKPLVNQQQKKPDAGDGPSARLIRNVGQEPAATGSWRPGKRERSEAKKQEAICRTEQME